MSARAKAFVIFVLTLFAYGAYAPQDPINPQHVTRLALTLAIIEEGRLDIDRFADRTIDKAVFNGHVYADKPPGLSMLAIPAVAATRAVLGLTGLTPDRERDFNLYLRVATISTVGALGALAVALLYLLSLRLGATESGALFATVTLAVGTPYFGWSTVFFSHAATGSLLLAACALAIWKRPAWCGLVLGYSLVTDLTAGPAAIAVGLLCLWVNGWPSAGRLVLGGLIGVLPLPTYNALAFGSPFKLGYSEAVGFSEMRNGFGLGAPNLWVLGQIMFGFYRGLLPLAPVLLLVPFGLFWMRRSVALTIAATMVAFLLINMSYHYWTGGVAVGPRHVIAMLPLACLALAFAWPQSLSGRVMALALLAVSIAISLLCATTTMLVAEDKKYPLFEDLWPRFVSFEYREVWPGLVVVVALLALLGWSMSQERRATS